MLKIFLRRKQTSVDELPTESLLPRMSPGTNHPLGEHLSLNRIFAVVPTIRSPEPLMVLHCDQSLDDLLDIGSELAHVRLSWVLCCRALGGTPACCAESVVAS